MTNTPKNTDDEWDNFFADPDKRSYVPPEANNVEEDQARVSKTIKKIVTKQETENAEEGYPNKLLAELVKNINNTDDPILHMLKNMLTYQAKNRGLIWIEPAEPIPSYESMTLHQKALWLLIPQAVDKTGEHTSAPIYEQLLCYVDDEFLTGDDGTLQAAFLDQTGWGARHDQQNQIKEARKTNPNMKFSSQ